MRLDGRYRLDEQLRTRTDNALWRGTDEVLDRPVAVRLVSDTTKAHFNAVCAAVSRAGEVSDARWVRVLDVGCEPAGKRLTAWVVSEWVDGPSLTATVRHETLRDPVATSIVLSCAQAVVAAHRVGARHGVLHPSEVVLPSEGTPRLAGLEVAAALQASGAADTAPEYDDTRALGGLLYAGLTGRWPLPGWAGPPPPTSEWDQPRARRDHRSRAVRWIFRRREFRA
jgi:serine/threonine protein kinase